MNQNVCSTFSQRLPVFFPKIFSSDVPNWPGLGCSLGPSAQFRQGPGTAWRAALLDVPGTLGAPSGWDFPGRFKGYNHTIPYRNKPHEYTSVGISPLHIPTTILHTILSLGTAPPSIHCHAYSAYWMLFDHAVRPFPGWLGAFRSTEVARLC